MHQIASIMNTHRDKVVLSQVGSFYELYYLDASEWGPRLGLRVVDRKIGKGDPVPMLGFPLPHLIRYVDKLVNELHQTVVIADQYPTNSKIDLHGVAGSGDARLRTSSMQFDRRVARIILPGTIVEELLRSYTDNNYLVCVYFPRTTPSATGEMQVGLAWTDVGVGSFHAHECLLRQVVNHIARLGPKEVLMQSALQHTPPPAASLLAATLAEISKRTVVTYTNPPALLRLRDYADNFVPTPALQFSTVVDRLTPLAHRALAMLAAHLRALLPHHHTNFSLPKWHRDERVLQIDVRTTEALELFRSNRRDSVSGTLLSTLRTTATPGGARMLGRWIAAPLANLTEILQRQNHVECFLGAPLVRLQTVELLRQLHDLLRIVQGLGMRRVDGLSLVHLAHTLKTALRLQTLLTEASTAPGGHLLMQYVVGLMSVPHGLAATILDKIDEQALVQLKPDLETTPEAFLELDVEVLSSEVLSPATPAPLALPEPSNSVPSSIDAPHWIIRPSTAPALAKAHLKLQELQQKRADMELRLRGLFKKLLLRFSSRHGHYLLVSGDRGAMADLDTVLEGILYTLIKRLLAETAWVRIPSYTDVASDIDAAVDTIRGLELAVLEELRGEIVAHIDTIRAVNDGLNYLDLVTSFAQLANSHRLVRPVVDNSTRLHITGGRHLVVEEALLGQLKQFEGNDTAIDGPLEKQEPCPFPTLWVVSGPNMGGKTTFLRQNALMVILAQMGLFVPADTAHIGVVDRLFTRVGGGDDLYRNMSTFMVEMMETSYILQEATSRSLAVVDEVGRGTTTREGIAIAYATLAHLAQHNQCRTLFATHFAKELHDLLADDQAVAQHVGYCTSGVRQRDGVVLDHRLHQGISTTAHALPVASSAGFPEEGLEVAHKVLLQLETLMGAVPAKVQLGRYPPEKCV